MVKKLLAHQIDATLVGGSVVSIYTANKYASQDLDFISSASHDRIENAMNELGFFRSAGGSGKDFAHRDCQFTVEFPPGPVAIGDTEPVQPAGSIEVNGVTVKMLSPTQCVMDRLLIFFLYNDRQCLDQALWVAQAHPINEEELLAWSRAEPNQVEVSRKLDLFLRLLKDPPPKSVN